MRLLEFFRNPVFMLWAIGAWLLSFLIISDSQVQNNFSYALLIIPTLISLRKDELQNFFSNQLVQLLSLVIASLIISAVIGDDNPLRQLKFGMIVLIFFIAVSRLHAINDKTAYRAAWLFLTMLVVYVTGNAIRQYLDGIWIPGMRLDEMNAKLGNVIYVTNTMGGMLAIITMLGIQKSRFREVFAAHALVLCFSLILLQTRSIIGIWIVTILLTYFAFYRYKLRSINLLTTLVMFATVIVIGIAYLFTFTSIGEHLLARNFYRPEIWVGYITETVRCGIWFGCGPDHSFQYLSHDGQTMVHPHSMFVTQFYKAGIIGLTPFILMTVFAGIYGYKRKTWAGWYFIVGALGVCFDGSSFLHSPNQRWLVFHLPLALLIAHQLNQKRLAISTSMKECSRSA